MTVAVPTFKWQKDALNRKTTKKKKKGFRQNIIQFIILLIFFTIFNFSFAFFEDAGQITRNAFSYM